MDNKTIIELLEKVQTNPESMKDISKNPTKAVKELLPNASDDDIGEVVNEINRLPEGTDLTRLNLGGIDVGSLLGLLTGGNNQQQSGGIGLSTILALLSAFSSGNKPSNNSSGLASLLGMGSNNNQNYNQNNNANDGLGGLLSLLGGSSNQNNQQYQNQQYQNNQQNNGTINVNDLLALLNAGNQNNQQYQNQQYQNNQQNNGNININDLLALLNAGNQNNQQNNVHTGPLTNKPSQSTKPNKPNKPNNLSETLINSLADRDGDGDVDIKDITNIAANLLKK